MKAAVSFTLLLFLLFFASLAELLVHDHCNRGISGDVRRSTERVLNEEERKHKSHGLLPESECASEIPSLLDSVPPLG